MAYRPRSSCTAIALALRCAAIGCALAADLGAELAMFVIVLLALGSTGLANAGA